MRDRTRELQGKQTMPNIVATPILTINDTSVNKDFGGIDSLKQETGNFKLDNYW
jgi:hypothetical protein